MGKYLGRVIKLALKEKPDVVCLQEVLKKDFPKLKRELRMGGVFYPMGLFKKGKNNKDKIKGTIGIVYLTKLPHSKIRGYYYIGKGNNPELKSPYSQNRVFVYSCVYNKGKTYNIGTTHFEWTPDGKPSQRQQKALKKLIAFINQIGDMILCGDFNAPREGLIYSGFMKYFNDNLPKKIKSTIDSNLHRKTNLNLVVDTIFSTEQYKVSKVKVIDGVSDHKAVTGQIYRKN